MEERLGINDIMSEAINADIDKLEEKIIREMNCIIDKYHVNAFKLIEVIIIHLVEILAESVNEVKHNEEEDKNV